MRRILSLVVVLGLLALCQVACVSPIDLNGLPCGTNGECGPAHTCEGGFCLRDSENPDAEQPNAAFLIGAPCRENSDCRSTGFSRATCLTEVGTQTWRDGYCSITCKKDSDCRKGNELNGGTICSIDSANTSQCLKACKEKSDCRSGYKCQRLTGASDSVCVPE